MNHKTLASLRARVQHSTDYIPLSFLYTIKATMWTPPVACQESDINFLRVSNEYGM
jgi:hypothetical protein